MRRTGLMAVVGLVVGLVLAACGGTAPATGGGDASGSSGSTSGGAATAAPATGGATTAKPKVVLVINGVLGDKSFFDSAQRGLDKAKTELGIETKTIELGIDPSKWQPGLEDAAANEQYDIMIVGTFQMSELLGAVAPQHADKKFIIFDAPVPYDTCANKCENVYSVLYKQNEGSYLAGLYAGLMAQQQTEGMNGNKTIGVIGGQDIPVINDFIAGYKQGAKDAGIDPDKGVLVQYAGGWNDPAKGKEITKAMYQQGASIVFNVAGGTGLGIFEAASEDKHWAVGVDSDQWLVLKDQKPELANRVTTSMMKNVDNSLFRALTLATEGKLTYGKPESLGIAEGGVGLARNENFEKLTPADVKARIDQAEKDVLAGKVTVDTVFK